MSYTIYGLRLRGSPEVRYVGLTSHTPESRLYSQTCEARLYGRRPTEGYSGWLLNNEIEAFAIAQVETKAEAHAKEREVAQFCVLLNHRLFNTWLVPAGKRLDCPVRRRKQRAAA